LARCELLAGRQEAPPLQESGQPDSLLTERPIVAGRVCGPAGPKDKQTGSLALPVPKVCKMAAKRRPIAAGRA